MTIIYSVLATLIIGLFISFIILIATSPFYKSILITILFYFLIAICCYISYNIYLTQPLAIENCKSKCPYYRKCTTQEKFEIYSKCAINCEG